MQIQKYKPQHIVTTIDGDSYYIQSEHLDRFMAQCEAQKFIKIEDSIIAAHQIKSVKPLAAKVNLKSLPSDLRKKVEARAREFKQNLNREPSDAELQNIIQKLRD